MDFRRIIAFGKSSYVISVPKEWMDSNNLTKGDVVFLDREAEKLILAPEEKEEEHEEKRTVVETDGKDIKRIKREIYAAYINYTDYIVLKGKEISKIAKDVTDVIHNLMALEIVDQDSEKIVAKDFLRIEDVNINDNIRKADIIIRSMLNDLADEKFNNYSELADRQDLVDRIYFVVLKVIKAIFNDLKLIKKINLSSRDLLNTYSYIFKMKRIAKTSKLISNKFAGMKKEEKSEIVPYIRKFKDDYMEVVKTMHSQDVEKAYNLSGRRDEEINNIEKAFKNKHIYIRDMLVDMYIEMHEILQRVYS